MKITAIEPVPLFLDFREPYHWAGRVDHGAAVLLIRVETDEGLVGLGESTAPAPGTGALGLLKAIIPGLIGRSPFDIENLMWSARHLGGFNDLPRLAALTLAGLEMALWDVIGQAAGRPVYQLLGGAFRSEVDYFGFPQGDTAEELAASAAAAVAAGHSVIYLKVGRGEARDLENVAAVRSVIGARRLRLDANEAWDPASAIRMINLLSRFDPEFIEQPTPARSLAALKQVKESCRVPIAADQGVFTIQDVYEICRRRAADVLVLSIHEVGGLLAFRKAAAVAEAAGLSICLHGQSVSGVTDLAQHHAALTVPNLTEGNQIMHQLLAEDLLAAPGLVLKNGCLGLLSGPGLGIQLNPEAVERAARRYRDLAGKMDRD
ncbi:MAG: mandelate racemase/muconate lactonizing enzyme family protein [Pseudomonadota bacterium]